jgi:N-methylhydantoinase B
MSMVESSAPATLDRVTFEVLKNGFANLVDQMSEQLLRTCYSFVIFCRDFSNCLCDENGDTVMQGTRDIAVHVGTLHFTAKAVLNRFRGDIHPGDVFMVNDPYIGGTHFCDVRLVRPVFHGQRLIAFTQSNGHWADVGGSQPGSFDIQAKEHFGEGLRITPIRIWRRGEFLRDIAEMIVSNTRAPADAMGDLTAQAGCTAMGEQRLLELVDRYGVEVVLSAFRECQDYVERFTRQKVAGLPAGTWSTEDFIDQDPGGREGLIPIRVSMTIAGGAVHYDFTGTHPAIGCFLNATEGSAFSAVVAGTKTFFPEIPLNSGFYRFIDAYLPPGTVVNAPHPVAVTGFCSGAYEKIMNAVFELWSRVLPDRALACCFNLEYLLVGGRDERDATKGRYFMWYDWMAGGWGGRADRDGSSATSPIFGVGLAIQSCEAQERLTPVLTSEHAITSDSGGPGKFRGGCGVRKGGRLTEIGPTVMSYSCDRARSVTWGIDGGLPSVPHGVTLTRPGERPRYLGAVFSGVPVHAGDTFWRPSAGGGGLGDPLERDPKRVLEDVIDGYVSVAGACRDYGVVIEPIDAEIDEWRIDLLATERERARIRAERASWLNEDAEQVAERLRRKEITISDAIRRYGVICDWDTGELLARSTEQFREALRLRARVVAG